MNECNAANPVFYSLATCANTEHGLTCTCNPGFKGDGSATINGYLDIDECTEDAPRVAADCDSNAVYAHIAGSFTCQCKAGFTDDGQTVSTGCTDRTNINECM